MEVLDSDFECHEYFCHNPINESEDPLVEFLKHQQNYEPVETFQFHAKFAENTNNGLYLNDFYLPEEVITVILSHIEPKDIFESTLVCKKWCNIIKSHTFWSTMYFRRYKKQPKKLPWYVFYCYFTTDYFDRNLLKNGNGENGYEYWKLVENLGDGFQIEDPPIGADPLPTGVPEFNGKTSCFATSYDDCTKNQEISFMKSRLMQLIFNQFKPHIYVSDWMAGRFDCGCTYELVCLLLKTHLVQTQEECCSDKDAKRSSANIYEPFTVHANETEKTIAQWTGSKWSKIEMVVKDYPCGVKSIIFQHEGKDTQFWKGHYGSKMAGSVLKILFDSIQSNISNIEWKS